MDAATRENGCLRVIPGSHRRRELGKHDVNNADGLSLPLEIRRDEFDATAAKDIVLDVGQISLHDVFSDPRLGSKPVGQAPPRPDVALHAHDVRIPPAISPPGAAARWPCPERTLYLMRGEDKSGRNDFRMRQ